MVHEVAPTHGLVWTPTFEGGRRGQEGCMGGFLRWEGSGDGTWRYARSQPHYLSGTEQLPTAPVCTQKQGKYFNIRGRIKYAAVCILFHVLKLQVCYNPNFVAFDQF